MLATPQKEQQAGDKLQSLMKRERALSDRLIRHKTLKENIVKDLQSAKKEAESKYGTSDLGELRALYQKKAQDNAKALSSYEEALSKLESALNAIDERLRAVNAK